MNASKHGGGAVAGNPGDKFPHLPVLYQEVLSALAPQTGKSYLDGVGKQKVAELEGIEVDSRKYWEKVYKIVNKARGFSKPAAAFKSILQMKESGPAGVPGELKDILEQIKATGDMAL